MAPAMCGASLVSVRVCAVCKCSQINVLYAHFLQSQIIIKSKKTEEKTRLEMSSCERVQCTTTANEAQS